jgi:hypothetical protein
MSETKIKYELVENDVEDIMPVGTGKAAYRAMKTSVSKTPITINPADPTAGYQDIIQCLQKLQRFSLRKYQVPTLVEHVWETEREVDEFRITDLFDLRTESGEQFEFTPTRLKDLVKEWR